MVLFDVGNDWWEHMLLFDSSSERKGGMCSNLGKWKIKVTLNGLMLHTCKIQKIKSTIKIIVIGEFYMESSGNQQFLGSTS